MVAGPDLREAMVSRAEATALLARREWRKLGSVDEFDRIAPRLSLIVSAGQLGAAREAAAATVALIGEGVGFVDPAAFAGVASDGRALSGLLYSPVVHARSLYGSGLTDADIMEAAGKNLSTIARTQVADAWRGASGAAIAATPQAGFYRVVEPPCCQRCAVLAGKFFRWNAGFQRHPRCDCVHRPAMPGDPAPAGIEPEQIKDLTAAQRQAIADGADMNQVINSHRAGSRSVDKMTTTEGMSRSGFARSAGAKGRRLTPEAIYRVSATREEAVRLLAKNGYIVGDLKNVARLAA